MTRPITYRGSVTDLATDVAFELTVEQGAELVAELQRFLVSEKGKFRGGDWPPKLRQRVLRKGKAQEGVFLSEIEPYPAPSTEPLSDDYLAKAQHRFETMRVNGTVEQRIHDLSQTVANVLDWIRKGDDRPLAKRELLAAVREAYQDKRTHDFDGHIALAVLAESIERNSP